MRIVFNISLLLCVLSCTKNDVNDIQEVEQMKDTLYYNSPQIKSLDKKDFLYRFQENNLWGYINLNGKIIVKPKYHQASRMIDGIAITKIRNSHDYRDEVTFVINNKGEVILETKAKSYNEIMSDGNTKLISHGYARIHEYREGKGKSYTTFINHLGDKTTISGDYTRLIGEYLLLTGKYKKKLGKKIIPGYLKTSKYGLFVFQVNRGYQIINSKDEVLKTDYKQPLILSHDRIASKVDRNYVLQKLNGEIVSNKRYTHIGDFSEGIAVARTKDKELFYINKNGESIFGGLYEKLSKSDNGYGIASANGRSVVINKQGEIVSYNKDRFLYPDRPPLSKTKIKYIKPFHDGVADVTLKNGLRAIVNEKYNIIWQQTVKTISVIDKKFSENIKGYKPFSENQSIVEVNGKQGVIDKDENFIIRANYDEIVHKDFYYLARHKSGSVVIFDLWGKVIIQGNYDNISIKKEDIYTPREKLSKAYIIYTHYGKSVLRDHTNSQKVETDFKKIEFSPSPDLFFVKNKTALIDRKGRIVIENSKLAISDISYSKGVSYIKINSVIYKFDGYKIIK